MGRLQQQELFKSLEDLYDSSDYSDLTVVTRTDRLKVHKAIVCPRSKFFAAACRFGKEALTGEITLLDDNSSIVRRMIDYLYTLDYPSSLEAESYRDTSEDVYTIPEPAGDTPVEDLVAEPKEPQAAPEPVSAIDDEWGFSVRKKKKGFKLAPPPSPPRMQLRAVTNTSLSTHAQVYAMADKYGISGLKALAVEKYGRAAAEYWDTEDFPPSIHIVYSSTPDQYRDLRDIVVKTISDHMSLLGTPEMEATMRELNGLAFDVLKSKWQQGGVVWQ